jgi:hypothetical protein
MRFGKFEIDIAALGFILATIVTIVFILTN